MRDATAYGGNAWARQDPGQAARHGDQFINMSKKICLNGRHHALLVSDDHKGPSC
jgi:hypothetical protein